MTQAIIDPTAGRRRGPAAQPHPADRLDSLRGLRIGLLENTKRNAAAILDSIGSELETADGVSSLRRYRKENFAFPLPGEMVEQIAAECDAVVIGVGDCGSCSASAVADGIALEALGLPAAVICTDAFEVSSGAMAALKGRPDFPYIRTAHPVANLTDTDVPVRAQQLADPVRDLLLGRTETDR